MHKLDDNMMDILACPICKGKLSFDQRSGTMICKRCRIEFSDKQGIPSLIPPILRG